MSQKEKRQRPLFAVGESPHVIPYSSSTLRPQVSSSQSSQTFLSHSSSTVANPAARTPSSLITGEKTFSWNRSWKPARPFAPSREKELDTKTKVVSELLIYPETDIGRNLEFYQSATRYSDFPIIPACKEACGIRCICQKGDNNTLMAMCSICGCWSHLSCYYLEGNVPDLFFCLFCQTAIVKSVRRRLRVVFRDVISELDRMEQILRPVANYCQQISSELMMRVTGHSEVSRISNELDLVQEDARESFERIRSVFQEAQKLLDSLMFVKKQGEGMDGDEWQEGPASVDSGQGAGRQSDGEEDDRYSSEGDSDQSSS